MWWIIALAVVALGLLAHIHAQDRREDLVAAVLDALAETELNQVQPTGDEVAVLVADRLGRRVGIAEVYDALVALRDAGLVVSEYRRLANGFSENKIKDGLPAVWRLADKAVPPQVLDG